VRHDRQRQGWLEAPYTQCPADLPTLARAMVHVAGDEIAIVGGLAWRDDHGTPDVMRGEETQIAGLPDDALAHALVVQPGTHSKWTVVASGAIAAFATYMTGELYAVLREHSILGRLMSPGASDAASFARGVDAGLRTQAGELPHALFAARTLPLFGELAPEGVADYLSGLLIGSEIAHARAWAAARGADGSPWLVGEPALCARYEAALRQAGLTARHGPADASARGLWRLARLVGMV
jgi:2-dehydro-3-deoxygalactonokinase